MFICAPSSQRLAYSASLCALTLWSAAKDLALFCESAGGLALRHGSSAVLVDSTIADCRASNSFGGGVIARDANLTLEGGSRIERCWSRGGGGALLAKDSNVALLNGSVIGESYSNVMGGGLHRGSGCTQSATPRTHSTPRACSQPPGEPGANGCEVYSWLGHELVRLAQRCPQSRHCGLTGTSRRRECG